MDERYQAYFETIGARIRRVRVERGMTTGELASAAGVSRSYVSMVEHGKRAVRMRVFIEFSEALEVPLPTLVDEHPDE